MAFLRYNKSMAEKVMQTFTKYSEAKRLLTQLSKEGVWSATAVLGDYQNLKNTKGELVAARYLLKVYTLYNSYRKKDFNNG